MHKLLVLRSLDFYDLVGLLEQSVVTYFFKGVTEGDRCFFVYGRLSDFVPLAGLEMLATGSEKEHYIEFIDLNKYKFLNRQNSSFSTILIHI